MRIEVNNNLTYECEETVQIGDKVLLPNPWWMDPGTVNIGTVTALSSEYEGECVWILAVLPDKEEAT